MRIRALGGAVPIVLVGLLGALVSTPAPAASDPALAEKARAFRRALLDRHLAREGVVLYRVNLETVAQDLERGTYPVLADEPVFTGLFAVASCLRAEVEADPAEALADAEKALAGLAFLSAVTGQPGLMARAVRRDAGTDPAGIPKGKWFRGAPPYENYVYRGDVSVDQYASGLLPAVAVCAHLFPEQTRELAVGLAGYLLETDMQLVDRDGERTRFGDLSWRAGYGFNSIYQLSGYASFALAAELDPDPRWVAQRDRLRDHYRVPARTRTTNVRFGALTNHSNDLMIFNLYLALVPLARANGDSALADLRHGLWRAWLRVRDDDNPYFAAILCRVEPESCDRQALAKGLELLRRFPLEKRKLGAHPELEALPRRWVPGRKNQPLAVDKVPMEIRPVSSLEWKSSPYRLRARTQPWLENCGVDFLLAYWLIQTLPPEEDSSASD